MVPSSNVSMNGGGRGSVPVPLEESAVLKFGIAELLPDVGLSFVQRATAKRPTPAGARSRTQNALCHRNSPVASERPRGG